MNTNESNQAGLLGKMDAGTADLWHIHKDHIKYGSIVETRVDFKGRSNAKIMEKIAEKVELYAKYQQTVPQQTTYAQCIQWIDDYIA